MFTQCEKCKATFRVNLREITVAKGMLRCGECYSVFDATKTLSTTIPAPFQKVVDLEKIDDASSLVPKPRSTEYEDINLDSNNEHPSEKLNVSPSIENIKPAEKPRIKPKKKIPLVKKLLLAAIALLVALLIFQILYNIYLKKHEEPLHEPEKIQMLSYNVFAHPNEAGVLLISASMKNKANRAQPYPVIEVILSDSKSEVIALRRFRPFEYLQNYNKKMMFGKHQQSKINLKISDPGSKATKFQYKFY